MYKDLRLWSPLLALLTLMIEDADSNKIRNSKAMSIPTRFSDGDYKNWLKCSLSLIIMKEALHDYTDNEVRKLHGDITQKVSSISCASSTGNQCGSCSSKDIRLTGNPRKWFISCNNNICDKWLQQILAVHDNPHNPSINWKNADIRLWPVDCYQVAKIFMPKGQDKTVKMPDDLDAPAILSLFKYCNWFRKDLPNTQMLSDLIDFRNKVLHSGDLKVSDSDKDRMIDLMIQLLKDLKIHGDVISNFETLKKEDIDISFRETEIRLLQEMVSGLVSNTNTVKKDMASMQDSVSDLSENMEKVRDTATETIGKVDAVNTDMEGIRKSLKEHKAIYDKMVSFFEKNPDIHNKEITEKIQTIGMDVKDLHSNLTRVETELQSRVSSLEIHCEETNVDIKGLRKQMEGLDVRLVAVEQQKKHETETTRKKRPETEGLRQLKIQTEDRLHTLRQLKCIPTNQAEKAKKQLKEKRSIVISGNPGEGKTTLSLHLIDNEQYEDKRVVVYSADDWKTVDMEHVDIVVLEDVFGKYDFDHGLLLKWMVYLPTIQEHVDGGKLQVIVTSRGDILSKAKDMLKSVRLFSDDFSLTLSSKYLTRSEKKDILNRELHRHERNINEDDKETCIHNFRGLIGFPQCCLLFASDRQLFDRGPKFFASPKEFFLENITHLEDTRFLSLAFLFCNGAIFEENLSSETIPEFSKRLLIELTSRLQISKKLASIELLRNAYDNFGVLYVVKSMSYDFSVKPVIITPIIMFTHPTVSEAVGHVLGQRCCEMVVKYGDSEYLYQRTYAADVEDSTSEKVFLPVSVYGLLAERMVHDVVNKSLVSRVVKHSTLKRPDFIKKLKDELKKGKVLKDFVIAGKDVFFIAVKNKFESDTLLQGKCVTFMQYILQGDKDVVRLVYSEFLEMLACPHNDNIPDCWQCEEKQNLLELALYYHHFEIADKLIAKKAHYTHVSLCNAARHGNLEKVQTITERLKENQVFKPAFMEAKYALYRAYLSGNQSLTEFLLKEGIILDSWYVVNAVKHGDINVLTNVVEHFKLYNKWNPKCDDASEALEVAINEEKDDVYDLLVQLGVSLKMKNLRVCIWCSQISLESLKKVIQHMKETGNWDPKCYDASKALEVAINRKKDDVYDLLVQEGISLEMKILHSVMQVSQMSLESLEKVIKHLKETDNWDPKCDDASKALEVAINIKKDDVYDLLVQEGVSLKMKNLPGVMSGSDISLESLKKVLQHLKDTDNWVPKCDDASKALQNAIHRKKYDVFDLLVQEGVSLEMKNLHSVMQVFQMSLESLEKVIKRLKDTDNWDPNCADAAEALEDSINRKKDDVYDLLVQHGVSLKMIKLPGLMWGSEISLESLKKVIQDMKDTYNWDPKCDDASKALEVAINRKKDDVFDLLVQEGVSLEMKNLHSVMQVSQMSLESLEKVIQHLKDTDNWDSKCDDASKALQNAIHRKKYDVYDLLVQAGVSLKMENLHSVMQVNQMSLESLEKVIKHLKDTDNWDPNCADAAEALEGAINRKKDDVYDLLVQHGVSLKMKSLPGLMWGSEISLESLKKLIQDMKDTDNWDPKCDDASKALEYAVHRKKYDVYDLLVQEGFSVKMENLPSVMQISLLSLESLEKIIQHMKETDKWDPKCDDASEALQNAINEELYDVYDLLVQHGVSLKMKNLPCVMWSSNISLESLKKAIQTMKDTDNWDPKCDDASKALENIIYVKKDDVYALLVQEGVSLEMKNLPGVVSSYMMSLKSVKKVIQHLKETDNWDPKCDDASKALQVVIHIKKYDVFDLLVQEGVSLEMKHLISVMQVSLLSLESLEKVIKHMKDTDNWDPKCDGASVILEAAICRKMYDVYDLLVQEGFSLEMKNLPGVISSYMMSLESVKKVIQHLKDTDSWDPRCDDASKALENAIHRKKDDVYRLLVQEGVSLKMKNLLSVMRCDISLESLKKVIQHLKESDNWDPKCYYTSKALEYAICDHDVFDLLVQEGVSLKMTHLLDLMRRSDLSLESLKKVIQHIKDNHNWDPNSDHAAEALEVAINRKKDDVYDMLVQEGVSLKMKNLLSVFIWCSQISLGSLQKVVQHIKETSNWDPTCYYASKALEVAINRRKYDVYALLVQEGVSLKMKNL